LHIPLIVQGFSGETRGGQQGEKRLAPRVEIATAAVPGSKVDPQGARQLPREAEICYNLLDYR